MKKKEVKEQPKNSPRVVKTYEEEIEFTCPVRGKVKQKVKVKRIESIETTTPEEAKESKNIAEQLDKRFSGLFISDDTVDGES